MGFNKATCSDDGVKELIALMKLRFHAELTWYKKHASDPAKYKIPSNKLLRLSLGLAPMDQGVLLI